MTKSAKKASTLPTARNRSVGGATEDGGEDFGPDAGLGVQQPPAEEEDNDNPIPVPPLNSSTLTTAAIAAAVGAENTNAPPIDALANAAIEAAEADRIAKLKADDDDDDDDEDDDTEMATANIASTYRTTDDAFEEIETLYNNNEKVEVGQSTKEMKEVDHKIKQIVEKINYAADIEQIGKLSSEAARLEAYREKLKDECVEMHEGVSRIKRSRHMAKQASEYWLKEKRDFKRFGEWKILLKKIDTVCPAAAKGGAGMLYPNPTDAREIQHLYQPSSKQSVPAPRKAKTTKAKENRLRQRKEWKYIPEATFKFYLQGGQKGSESLEGNGFEWRNGYIYCHLCDSFLKRPVDMKQHVKS